MSAGSRCFLGHLVTRSRFSENEIRNILRDRRLGLTIPEILQKHGKQTESLNDGQSSGDIPIVSRAEEDRDLKQLLGDLLLEMSARGEDTGMEEPALGNHSWKLPNAINYTKPQEPIFSVLQRSRIIPAVRGPEYIDAALKSPSVIVWLLYGTPLTLPAIVRQVRSAGKLPIANLDLLTGFAQDADGIELLASEGIAGVVSTRQSVLRSARAQGIIAVQRTFVVDSIAVGNISRALQHFVPDAIELLPAAAVPLCISTLRAAQPQLPVIATGLVTNMRQVDDQIRCGVSSVATSDVSLWVL